MAFSQTFGGTVEAISDCWFFDLFHTEVSNNGTKGAAHGATMNLLLNFIVEHKIIVRQNKADHRHLHFTHKALAN